MLSSAIRKRNRHDSVGETSYSKIMLMSLVLMGVIGSATYENRLYLNKCYYVWSYHGFCVYRFCENENEIKKRVKAVP